MVKVYFFSRHEATAEMVTDLGGKISAQYKGTISNVKLEGNMVTFNETPLGESSSIKHQIEADSIVVAVAPLPLQESWLKAGVTLLLPQNRRQTTESGEVLFNYSGLLRVLRISIETEQWAGAGVSVEQKHSERSAMI